MAGLFRLMGWAAFTAVMSFVFLVLLDYGPSRFSEGIQKESERVWMAVNRRVDALKTKVKAPANYNAPARTQAR